MEVGTSEHVNELKHFSQVSVYAWYGNFHFVLCGIVFKRSFFFTLFFLLLTLLINEI